MLQSHPPYKVPLESAELDYLVNKKHEDVTRLVKALKILVVVIIAISVAVGIILFIIAKVSPDTFTNRNEPPPDILAICLKLMLLLMGVVGIATYYSYARTLRKIINDIKSGEKTIEPCLVIRKLYMRENDTYNVYITSTIRYSLAVTREEYGVLNVDDKINIEYSTYSKIFFGYTI